MGSAVRRQNEEGNCAASTSLPPRVSLQDTSTMMRDPFCVGGTGDGAPVNHPAGIDLGDTGRSQGDGSLQRQGERRHRHVVGHGEASPSLAGALAAAVAIAQMALWSVRAGRRTAAGNPRPPRRPLRGQQRRQTGLEVIGQKGAQRRPAGTSLANAVASMSSSGRRRRPLNNPNWKHCRAERCAHPRPRLSGLVQFSAVSASGRAAPKAGSRLRVSVVQQRGRSRPDSVHVEIANLTSRSSRRLRPWGQA